MDTPELPSSPASPFQLAVAALFGASVMALSAFYIHKRSVDQVFNRLIKLRHRARRQFTDDEEVDFSDWNADNDKSVNVWRSNNTVLNLNSFDDGNEDGYGQEAVDYRVSSSMPNVTVLKNERKESGFSRTSEMPDSSGETELIPTDLPPARTDYRDGESCRPVTPQSTAAAYTVESTWDSDIEEAETSEENALSYQDDMNLTTSNQTLAQSQVEKSIYIHAHKSEAKSNTDHAEGEVYKTSDNVVADDLLFGNNNFSSVTSFHDSLTVEEHEVMKMIHECLELRDKYVFRESIAPWRRSKDGSSLDGMKNDPLRFVPVEASTHVFKMVDGVVHVYASENDSEELFPVANSTTFFTDMHHILKVMSIGTVRSVCYHRLRFLEEKFRLHLLVNADREFLAQKSAPHRDFYNIRKVDTHIHHSACMNQKHLLRFIKSKLRKEPDEVVIYRDGQYLTLKEVFDSLDLTGYDLNVDLLDVHADKSTFHRFDKFNLKYNPCGQSRLREIFLKQDNLIQGRFLAEVTKEVLSDLEASKYQLAEYRISIYGRKQSEWDQLGSWFVNNGLYSENAVWLIQLPKLYNVYRSMGTVTSFQNIIDNIFIPLFEVTVDPNSHPHLHVFLLQVVGFDMVDDESKPERRPKKHMPTPSEWTNEFNPAFSYYAYYCYANLYTLNKLRESKGFPTIRFRPHCGEAGELDHLAAGFLLCHNISHGINLRKTPVLQYLYYLAQIGLAMSPLSNNSLFLDYHRNPFPMFFQRGLNVSLSSDDPLQIHLTKEPLVEEYSVAAKVWKLSSCDLCEIARNSLYQSGFPHSAKAHWFGEEYYKRGPKGNDIHKTNVPNLRISFRHETWMAEMQYAYAGRAKIPDEIDY
ncbi:probable AMP deaminase isoform X2 [Andrographis paniculata]|uniref:probable AMP deaminase isoform X2 n=1 Tax=Andrographis paniculata TaxID=175694 RepID=UPI0021E9172E|nr:probable AMP deaminase isoform X2 [Andrographis paniculata]